MRRVDVSPYSGENHKLRTPWGESPQTPRDKLRCPTIQRAITYTQGWAMTDRPSELYNRVVQLHRSYGPSITAGHPREAHLQSQPLISAAWPKVDDVTFSQ